ncbi:uncharacterized protein [Dermacentor albipictus]|uniref:uncharacterized protein isoform X2 n=1 Tax=Dermacentor albipictus TaxID=60249 RepID=UPI0038FCF4D0
MDKSLGSEQGTEQNQGRNYILWCLFSAACVLFVVALLVTLLLVLGVGGVGEVGTTSDNEDQHDVGGLGSEASTGITIPIRVAAQPSITTTGSTQSVTTLRVTTPRRSPTSPRATRPRSTSPSPASPSTKKAQRKPGLLGSLLCTVREGFTKSTFQFPPDGLCGIITFDSLFTGSGNTLEPPYNPDLQYFLDTARQHRVTEYAIGLNYSFCRSEARMKALAANANTKLHLNALWDQRVYHYGLVNTPMRLGNSTPAAVVMESARGLKLISDLMKDRKDPMLRPSYTILHFPLHPEVIAPNVSEALRSHPVDVFVLIAFHVDADMKYLNCRMVPPTIRSTQLLPLHLKSEYPIRLDRIISGLVSKQAQWPAAVSFALALGMGGRWYVPKNPPANVSLGDECTNDRYPAGDQIVSITKVCSNRGFNGTFYKDGTYDASVAYDSQQNWLFTYDSAPSLRSKVCKSKRNAVDVNYTLAAVNIQFEDYMNNCGYGPYHRLTMLKAVAGFLTRNYTSAAEEDACMKVG